ncbi:imidazole glycerol phosphate synthase subunit HisH [Pararhizobium sp.]|uniref:imidazole glycerol phosphate synthase subunit HisH n=1 Tax=Pararhizobium sp. TaxID=1977563 RepID=UPI0027267B8B|nr:imidazole glycerol phosphate synthase subunit HisH [Pararhizobium sp.]MDO9418350.1 imidazole glycerol phosphate synthase subunit HisH [Pararhizobium sp.]
MIVIVDYDVGNLASVCNMLRKAGADAVISRDEDEILRADKLVLPGVGHFDYGMKMLQGSGLRNALNVFALEFQRPVLGICLGAQMLGKKSAEGDQPGLGWIDMECRRFPGTEGFRVPHMGWAEVNRKQPSMLFDESAPDARYYFVHSYYMACENEQNVVATCNYGIEFACSVQRDNIFGVQFHPEKSLRHGLALMRAFAEYTANE